MAHRRIACARRDENEEADISAECPHNFLRAVCGVSSQFLSIFLLSTRIETIIGSPSNRRDDWVGAGASGCRRSELLRELNSAAASTGAGFGGGRAAFGGLPDDFRAGAAEQLHLPLAAEAALFSSFGFLSSHFRSVSSFFTFGE
jgi:hypothetical protein